MEAPGAGAFRREPRRRRPRIPCRGTNHAAGCGPARAHSPRNGVLGAFMNSSVVASILVSLALFAFVFWPERNPFVQADKTRVDYLRERKDAIYENLRDLNFEYQAGKYPEAEYAEQRRALEDEAAQVIAEMEGLTARGMKAGRLRV